MMCNFNSNAKNTEKKERKKELEKFESQVLGNNKGRLFKMRIAQTTWFKVPVK